MSVYTTLTVLILSLTFTRLDGSCLLLRCICFVKNFQLGMEFVYLGNWSRIHHQFLRNYHNESARRTKNQQCPWFPLNCISAIVQFFFILVIYSFANVNMHYEIIIVMEFQFWMERATIRIELQSCHNATAIGGR